MKGIKMKKCCGLIMLVAFLLIFLCPGGLKGAEIPPVEDVIKGKADLPTIEDLTGGKVKIGDLIDKNNVDLVKEYLNLAAYEAVKQGMVLRMGTQLPPAQIMPKYFREATERNWGKAIIDENGTAYYEKLGTLWPGGLPFPEPKTGLEVMANVKYGCVWDELRNFPCVQIYVNSKGRAYKKITMDQRFINCTTRSLLPPLGTIPGNENILYKRVSVMTYPLEVKGLGQYSVRYYDDAKQYDTGFAYLPAFKRTIRTSATTWQDNIGGSDLTFGDGQGINDPFSDWSFKLIETRYVLMAEPKSPVPILNEKGMIDKKLKFDVGRKFPRLGWTIWPAHVVEAIPKIKHVYGKKILYADAYPYWSSAVQIALMDIYDRQMKLWKFYMSLKGNHYVYEDEVYTPTYGVECYDLQADHMTQFLIFENLNKMNYKPGDITFRTLLEIGR